MLNNFNSISYFFLCHTLRVPMLNNSKFTVLSLLELETWGSMYRLTVHSADDSLLVYRDLKHNSCCTISHGATHRIMFHCFITAVTSSVGSMNTTRPFFPARASRERVCDHVNRWEAAHLPTVPDRRKCWYIPPGTATNKPLLRAAVGCWLFMDANIHVFF